MPTLILPTSELEAVNECLENIGQAPVNTISGSIGVDAKIALNLVRKVSRELQSKGWYWNIEKNFTLTPTADGDILLPSNTLSVDSTGTDHDRDVVQRGRRLYDRDNHRYTFDGPINVELTVGLNFDELPETARRYITLRSARIFQDRIEGTADSTDSFDEQAAMANLVADQLRVEDNNVLSGSYGMVTALNRIYY